jgi:hypothetical protein
LGAEKPKDQSSIAKIQETRGGQIYLVEETGVPRDAPCCVICFTFTDTYSLSQGNQHKKVI